MVVGVLALQGDFKEHLASLEQYKIEGREVRVPSDLNGLDGLILPGGESTTIAKLLVSTGLNKKIVQKYKEGMKIWGTCAGAILLAKKVQSPIPLDCTLGLLDIEIDRNSYGRQLDSFSTWLKLDDKRFEADFIRAPRILSTGRWEKVLIEHKGDPVMIRTKKVLASTFHSELKHPNVLLEYFLQM